MSKNLFFTVDKLGINAERFLNERMIFLEQTLVIIKPDGIERKLLGNIISRYEKKGLNIRYCKMLEATREVLEEHYLEHKDRDFYEELIDYMMRGSILVMVLEGHDAIEKLRKINGSTNPIEAELGSIRGDYAISKEENLVHASDSKEAVEREKKIWLKEEMF